MSHDLTESGRASQIFSFDEARVASPVAEEVWRTRSEPVASFTSIAVAEWEMVVTRERGHTLLTVRGPETHASSSPIPEDASFVGCWCLAA